MNSFIGKFKNSPFLNPLNCPCLCIPRTLLVLIFIIGEPDAFLKSIYNNSEYIRKTKLLDKIKYKFEVTG